MSELSLRWVKELAIAEDAAREAGALLRDMARGPRVVLDASGRDIKMAADRETEAQILARLAPSGYTVLAEEGGAQGEVSETEPLWVVDPLDGTMNFSRGIPFYCTSIALMVGEEPVLGVVHDPLRAETFSGLAAGGCWLNGTPVQVSTVTDPAQAVLATGLPTFGDYSEAHLTEFALRLGRFKKVRMLGSAALMLASVAAGRVDAYGEDNIMLWDVAAGLALVRGAGGYVSSTPSSTHHWGRYIRCAASSTLWEV